MHIPSPTVASEITGSKNQSRQVRRYVFLNGNRNSKTDYSENIGVERKLNDRKKTQDFQSNVQTGRDTFSVNTISDDTESVGRAQDALRPIISKTVREELGIYPTLT